MYKSVFRIIKVRFYTFCQLKEKKMRKSIAEIDQWSAKLIDCFSCLFNDILHSRNLQPKLPTMLTSMKDASAEFGHVSLNVVLTYWHVVLTSRPVPLQWAATWGATRPLETWLYVFVVWLYEDFVDWLSYLDLLRSENTIKSDTY